MSPFLKCLFSSDLFVAVAVGAVAVIQGSLSIDDGEGNYNATNKQFNGSSEENKCAARAARSYEQVRGHPLQNNNVKLQCLLF